MPEGGLLSHVLGKGEPLFEIARRAGCDGIISKKLCRRYNGRPSRDWLNAKVAEI